MTHTVTLPRASQRSVVTQRIGLTDITITYHSPLVKGRKIWGALVPYGEVWSLGANENTTIFFTHDVTVEGKPLAAGTYGLHAIPTEQEWTIIFSKNHTSWRSYTYKKEEDALRVNVKPAVAGFREWLSYDFLRRESESVEIALTWEKLCVAFRVDVDVKNIVVANMRNELRSLPGFSWEGLYNAANYCLNHDANIDEALTWIEKSIRRKQTFSNLRVKAGLLAKKGQTKESEELLMKALPLAEEGEINNYAYELLGQRKTKEAIDVLTKNVTAYPDSWNAYDSLAEGYVLDGDMKRAVETYKMALTKAPESEQARIKGTVQNLEHA